MAAFAGLESIERAAVEEVVISMPVPEPRKAGVDRYAPKPTDSAAVAEWRQRMGTDAAKGVYKQRSSTIETINGELKTYRGLVPLLGARAEESAVRSLVVGVGVQHRPLRSVLARWLTEPCGAERRPRGSEIQTTARGARHAGRAAAGTAKHSHVTHVLRNDDPETSLSLKTSRKSKKFSSSERTKRSESIAFRVFYELYKALHVILTGVRVRVGNFSVIPKARLQSLVVVSELWNHYAAAAFKSRQPLCLIATRRADRLSGRSRMNFVDLVAHGLGAMSVYGEIIGVRLLVLACILIFAALAGAVSTIIVRLTTNLAIPGWATSTVGILLVMLTLGVMLAFLFCFVILSGRQGSAFLPCRDYAYFVQEVRRLRD